MAEPFPAGASIGATWDVVLSLRRLHFMLDLVMDRALEPHGTTFTQYLVMESLEALPNQHTAELARAFRVRPQSMRHVVTRLMRAGLVEPLNPDPAGRGLMLTSSGWVTLRRCREIADRKLRHLRMALRDPEVNVLGNHLARLQRSLEFQPGAWWWQPI
jgi:DNA-binding MarR family transcriptional regulator